jgi:hypothetical protein
MPSAGGSGFTIPRVKEAEVGEWFQGEVWRLLGWEVLGTEMNDRLRGRYRGYMQRQKDGRFAKE